MNSVRLHRLVQSELDGYAREALIDGELRETLGCIYPTTAWDWHALGRWFTVFGAVAAAGGGARLLYEVVDLTLGMLALFLAAVVGACLVGARKLERRGRVWTPRSMELLAGLAAIGLSFTVFALSDPDWSRWPHVLLLDLVVLLAATYTLNNVLLLVLSVTVFFTWFGGFTGYLSGWGMYFFGMNYPLRFLLAGIGMAGLAAVHLRAERGALRAYRGFFKTWLSAGVFLAEMALWLLSIFGNYGEVFSRYGPGFTELMVYNGLWATMNGLLLYVGARFALPMLTGYAATFLIIQVYTFYFDHLAPVLPPAASLLIVGGSLLALASALERRRRQRSPS